MVGRITLLGTGTCQLLPNRMASSVLVQLEGIQVVYDFGRGVAHQLARLGLGSNDLQHIIISHFHPDHSSDLLPYLHAACYSRVDPRSKVLHIYGPPGWRRLLESMLSLYGPDALYKADRFSMEIHEVPSATLEIEGWIFEFVSLPHRNNHGLAFTFQGQRYAFTGDCHYHDQEVAFILGAELAVIDAGHHTPDEIIELAARAQPRCLVLSHLYEEPPTEGLNIQAQKRGYLGRIITGEDLMSFPLGRE